MGRLLRSEFYRLFKSISFFVCTLIIIVLSVGSAFLYEWSYRIAQQQGFSGMMPLYEDGISYGLMTFSGGNTLILMAIFITIFVTSEYAHGTMKNTISKGYQRYQIYLSKLITMLVGTSLILIVMFVTGVITGSLIRGSIGDLSGDKFGILLATLGIQLLLHAAFVAVFVMIANTIRNNGGVIAINIVGILIVFPLIFQALDLIFTNKVVLSKYSMQMNITLFGQLTQLQSEAVIRAVLLGAAYLVATTVIGIFAFNKTDVK